jgi:protein involved in ribonucleotide reduction
MNEQSAPIRILFISISGNTRAFVKKMTEYAQKNRQSDSKARLVEATEVTNGNQLIEMWQPFAVFVPTYLDGGDGINSGNHEIMTNELHDTLEDNNNYRKCYGVVGSGNRNFNAQFGLTAKQYANQFGFPVIDFYELRGTSADVVRVYQHLSEFQQRFEEKN